MKHRHPCAVWLSHGREKQGSTHPSTCCLNRSLLLLTLPKGSKQGAGGEPWCSASSLSKEGTIRLGGPCFLCSPHAAASHETKASSCLQTAVWVMPVCICLCLYVAFCLCFALTLSLGLFSVHPGMHSDLCCLSLLFSVACTKGSFQRMSSGP